METLADAFLFFWRRNNSSIRCRYRVEGGYDLPRGMRCKRRFTRYGETPCPSCKRGAKGVFNPKKPPRCVPKMKGQKKMRHRDQWAFFRTPSGQIAYNKKCTDCRDACKMSFRAVLLFCPRYRKRGREEPKALPKGEASKASGYTPATVSGAMPHTP